MKLQEFLGYIIFILKFIYKGHSLWMGDPPTQPVQNWGRRTEVYDTLKFSWKSLVSKIEWPFVVVMMVQPTWSREWRYFFQRLLKICEGVTESKNLIWAHKGFYGRWARIWHQNYKIQNGWSNMADDLKKFQNFDSKLSHSMFYHRWLRFW